MSSDRAPRLPRIPRVRLTRAARAEALDLRGDPRGGAGSLRGAHALEVVPQPLPGHLYLDPDVPAHEVITLTCGTWTGRASHVWTGVGWARLVPGPIARVPSARVG